VELIGGVWYKGGVYPWMMWYSLHLHGGALCETYFPDLVDATPEWLTDTHEV